MNKLKKCQCGGHQNHRKDMKRKVLHDLGVVHLYNQIRGRKYAPLLAVCLPGLRPDHERKILRGCDLIMAENDPIIFAKVKKHGVLYCSVFDVPHAMNETHSKQWSNRKIHIIDLDMFYSVIDVDAVIQMVTHSRVASTFVLRVTACTRSIGRKCLDSLNRKLSGVGSIISVETLGYRGGCGDGAPMAIRQWVIRKNTA